MAASTKESLKNTKMSKKVIITGVTGQDGSLMVDHLLATTNHEIYGIVRRLSVPNRENLKHIKSDRFHIVEGDVTDQTSIERIVRDIRPDYFINFAANSFVGNSWGMPMNHVATNFLGVTYQLEALREYAPLCRYYNAGSSEEWGNVDYSPQDEKHPMKPRSPYGVSKCASRLMVKVYRESYNLYAIQGHLLNHEGVRRGHEFVTRKISLAVARIKKAIDNGQKFEPLELGNLEAKRDWSDAEDFVRGVWMMLNQDFYNENINPWVGDAESYNKEFLAQIKEYVLSSNETHTIKEFVELAFEAAGIKGVWFGEGLEERFVVDTINSDDPRFLRGAFVTLMKINPEFYRPCEVELLHGDSTQAREDLGWKPKTSFQQLVKKMVDHDLNSG